MKNIIQEFPVNYSMPGPHMRSTNPEKNIPVKPDDDNDFTMPKPKPEKAKPGIEPSPEEPGREQPGPDTGRTLTSNRNTYETTFKSNSNHFPGYGVINSGNSRYRRDGIW